MNRRLLFLVGCNLSFLHLCLLRELASLRYCTELVLLFLLLSFFVGQSLGYALHQRLEGRALYLGLVWLAIPLPVLLCLRSVAGHLRADALSPLFYLLSFLYLASITAVYSAFLPKAITTDETAQRTLAQAYTAELAGSLVGLVLVGLLGSHQGLAMALLYPLSLALLVYWLKLDTRVLVSVVILSGLSLLVYGLGDRKATELYYQTAFDYSDQSRLIFSESSPYQKVDVLDDEGEKILFLNGVQYFSEGDLDSFNFYLSELPARLIKPKRVLFIGAGSMSGVGRVAPFAESVVTVELDPAVIRASREVFAEEHPPENFQHEIVYDDARHFLRHTQERFDLILMDIPTAFTLQTGTLFTREFYQLAKSRLKPQGVLSVYLTQPIKPGENHDVAGPILAALAGEFEEFLLLTARDAQNSFVYASPDLPFQRSDLDRTLGQLGHYQQELFETDIAQREAARWVPASLRNLQHIWEHQ